MSFLNNLAKGFVRSAVNQVGRDGGKVISNKVYKGSHGTPIYDSQGQGTEDNYIDSSLQPEIKSGGVMVIIKGLLIQIIPFGSLAVLYKAIHYLTRESTDIYASMPNKVADKRYSVGYRIDGYSVVKSGQRRRLSEEELSNSKSRGKAYLISLVVVAVLLFLAFMTKK